MFVVRKRDYVYFVFSELKPVITYVIFCEVIYIIDSGQIYEYSFRNGQLCLKCDNPDDYHLLLKFTMKILFSQQN